MFASQSIRFFKHKMLTIFVYAVLCVISSFRPTLSATCDLKPKGAVGLPRDAGTRYRIVIANSPEKYVPGQTYNVILQGRNSIVEEPNMFNGFMLTIEPAQKTEDLQIRGPLVAGFIKILPNERNSKIDEICPNTIVHTSLTFITSIEFQWVAPNPGIGCVIFRAVVMEQHIWYKDTGGLMLELCETEAFDRMDIPYRCRSCNEAKYEMNFEGLWTRQGHPQSYPDNSWLTRFSDVIGASHAFDYRFWKVNESASPGLVEYLERENMTMLELEIKNNNTRTVIKAKGLSYPNITGKTFTVFRVDPEHHLLSIISFIRPSPDWFVGISGLALCDNDGKWTPYKLIDLYPYDLGLWGDLNYESRMKPTEEAIHKIEDSKEPESPFYSNSEEKLKPFARVHLIKSREYERHCPPSNEESETNWRPTEGGQSGDENLIQIPATTENNRISSHQYTTRKLIVEKTRLEEPDHGIVTDKECEDVPFLEYPECSVPQCDVDRVRILYRQFDVRLQDHCQEINSKTEKLQPCDRNCSGGKEPTSRSTLIKCGVSEWPEQFSPCDIVRCVRNRTRHALDPFKKRDPECLKIQWVQELNCLPQECRHYN